MSEAAGSTRPGWTPTRLIGFFTGNRVAGRLLMLVLLIAGVYTALQLEVAMLPELETGEIAVTVPYPGASPAEVAEDVNRRIEERLIALEGVERTTSYAAAGLGRIVVALDAFADPQEALDDIRLAVDRIEAFPPPSAERPDIAELGQPRNVMTVAVASQTLSEMDLRRAAERVQEDLMALPALTQVVPLARREREIAIEASEEALRRHGLTIPQLASRVRAESLNLSAGEVRADAGEFVVRTHGKRTRAEQFENIVVRSNVDGSLLRLGDLARIEEGFSDARVAVRIDGRPAQLIGIDRGKGEDALRIADAVREMLAGYEAPRGTGVFVLDDKTEYVWSRVANLVTAGFMGFALVFILLALVFDFRVAFWVAVGVPTTFLGAILLFPAFDLTINLATLVALVIMIGIVVDDAVVVGESIADWHERGVQGAAAALGGAREVLVPVTLGCITTGLAFVPLLFLDEVVGQFLRPLPIVVAMVLIVSLAEAFLVLPSHLSGSRPWSRWPLVDVQARAGRQLTRWRDDWVAPAIAAAVRRPSLTLVAGAGLVAAAFALLATGVVRSDPNTGLSYSQIQVALEFPPGTPVAATSAAADRVADIARQPSAWTDAIRTVTVVVGQQLANERLFGIEQQPATGGHLATVLANVVHESQRSLSTADIERLWLAAIGNVPGALAVRATTANVVTKAAYAISHPEPAELAAATTEIRRSLDAYPGVQDVSDTLTPGALQYDVELTEAGAAAGLSARALAGQLRARLHGIDVQRIQRGREEVRVRVRYPPSDRQSLRELRDERITVRGVEVPLGTVARIEEIREPSTLMRIDGVPAAEIVARFGGGETRSDVDAVVARVGGDLAERDPDLRLMRLGGAEGERKAIESALYTVPLVLLMIYTLIAVVFRSYWQPLLILAGIPFAFAGAVFGHWILGYSVPPSSLLGVVAVAGVAVNDTLLLMDRYNRIQTLSPMPVIAAVSAAARQRFRPIALTTATTVVVMLPLLIVKAEIMQTFTPLVVSLVFGLIASSAAILFVVPTLLYLAETMRERRTARQ